MPPSPAMYHRTFRPNSQKTKKVQRCSGMQLLFTCSIRSADCVHYRLYLDSLGFTFATNRQQCGTAHCRSVPTAYDTPNSTAKTHIYVCIYREIYTRKRRNGLNADICICRNCSCCVMCCIFSFESLHSPSFFRSRMQNIQTC